MQLKEEFRTYEALRREHDSQIVQIAMEAGLRIAPDQWSSLLYGDQTHKSHMQSIIDKVDLCCSLLLGLALGFGDRGLAIHLSELRVLEGILCVRPLVGCALCSPAACHSWHITCQFVHMKAVSNRGIVDIVHTRFDWCREALSSVRSLVSLRGSRLLHQCPPSFTVP